MYYWEVPSVLCMVAEDLVDAHLLEKKLVDQYTLSDIDSHEDKRLLNTIKKRILEIGQTRPIRICHRIKVVGQIDPEDRDQTKDFWEFNYEVYLADAEHSYYGYNAPTQEALKQLIMNYFRSLLYKSEATDVDVDEKKLIPHMSVAWISEYLAVVISQTFRNREWDYLFNVRKFILDTEQFRRGNGAFQFLDSTVYNHLWMKGKLNITIE